MISFMRTGICLLFLQVCCISCEEEKLPPITTEGKNTLGCLVNGKLWLPLKSFLQGGIYAELQTVVDTVGVNIYGDNAKASDGIAISFFDSPVLQTHFKYDLATPGFVSQYRSRTGKTVCYYDSVISGNVKLLKFDLNQRVISGTFEFKAYSIDCDATVSISDGRFDLMMY